MAKDLKANSTLSVLTVFLEMLDRDFLGVAIWKTSLKWCHIRMSSTVWKSGTKRGMTDEWKRQMMFYN